MSCRKHGDSVDGQYNRFAVARADVDGCFGIGRQMDKMTGGRMQTLFQYRRNRALSRTVIQNLREALPLCVQPELVPSNDLVQRGCVCRLQKG